MRVLVTGGAGYIGSHTLVDLIGQAHEVCVYDNYCNSSPIVLGRVEALTNGKVRAVEGDIRDADRLAQTCADFRPEAVVHFAGVKAVGESQTDPVRYYDINVTGTLALTSAMDAVGCRRLIFSSSATVYGEPDYQPFDEGHPKRPKNVYGRSKLMAETILTDWAELTGATAVLLRYFNPVGAHPSGRLGEDPKGVPDNLMPYLAQVAVGQRDALSIFGDDYDTPDGTGQRDYIHVVDLARAHVAALDWSMAHEGARAFNIGTGRPYSVREMVAAFSAASGREIPTRVAPRRAGDVAAMRADPSRAASELGWTAARDLTDMAESTWYWQSRNPEGYVAGDG